MIPAPVLVGMAPEQHLVVKELVGQILRHAADYAWELQGLGMLRLRMSPTVRLHVWSPKHVYGLNTTKHHTHPWDFTSYVIAGHLTNIRYVEVESFQQEVGSVEMNRMSILCGPEASPAALLEAVRLRPWMQEQVYFGERYTMLAAEIHETRPDPGTVSIIVKRYLTEQPNKAYIYWPMGETWGSAAPRPATKAEIVDICADALRQHWRSYTAV